MAFKTANKYNEERFGKFFMLRNDGDSADVIFLYQDPDDVLVADVHYLKSENYSGYAHCNGHGCPACAKNIRVQTKLFIPLYNIDADEIQFFDRTMRFEPQLKHDLFDRYPNPSQCIARITRHGVAGSVDTKYTIEVIGKNTIAPYDSILAKFNAKMPDYYNEVCRELTNTEMSAMLNSSNIGNIANSSYNELPDYTPSPRVSIPAPVAEPPQYSAPAVPDINDPDEDIDDPVF